MSKAAAKFLITPTFIFDEQSKTFLEARSWSTKWPPFSYHTRIVTVILLNLFLVHFMCISFLSTVSQHLWSRRNTWKRHVSSSTSHRQRWYGFKRFHFAAPKGTSSKRALPCQTGHKRRVPLRFDAW
jgi:hypothetical protein